MLLNFISIEIWNDDKLSNLQILLVWFMGDKVNEQLHYLYYLSGKSK